MEKMNVQTSDNMGSGRTPMTEAEIDAISKKMGEEMAKAEKVTVRIPKSEFKNDDVVEVGINGYNYLIKRGETVQLPQPIVDILANAGIV